MGARHGRFEDTAAEGRFRSKAKKKKDGFTNIYESRYTETRFRVDFGEIKLLSGSDRDSFLSIARDVDPRNLTKTDPTAELGMMGRPE